jgi:hypothetical protein
MSIDDRMAGSIAWHTLSCISLFFSIFIRGMVQYPLPASGASWVPWTWQGSVLHARARYPLSDRSYVSFMDGYMTRTSVTDCKLLFPRSGQKRVFLPGIDPYMSCNASTHGKR